MTGAGCLQACKKLDSAVHKFECGAILNYELSRSTGCIPPLQVETRALGRMIWCAKLEGRVSLRDSVLDIVC